METTTQVNTVSVRKRNRVPGPLNHKWVKTLVHNNDLHIRKDFLAALESLVAKKIYDSIERLKTEGKRTILGMEDL